MARVADDLWRTLCNLAEEQGEHVRLNWGVLSAADGTHAVAVRMCCSRHSCRLVCAFRVPVPRARSHQRAGAHRADVAREAPGKSGAREQRILCCVDSRVVLVAVSEGRPGVSILNSESLHSSVSVRHCRSTCCGYHPGEILPAHHTMAPLSLVGNARSRFGQHKLLPFSSGQQRWPVS